MKLKGRFEFLGIESFKGRKDPNQTFYNACFLDGLDSGKVFCSEEQANELSKFPTREPLDVVFNYNPQTHGLYIDSYNKQK